MKENEKSYMRHKEHDQRMYAHDGERMREIDLSLDPSNINSWRHKRILSVINPLIETYPSAKWLTVGDSFFASDARYLCEHGIDVTASNICDAGFEEAKKRGYIKKYSVQNAEALTFSDDEFDFILCKLAYHHFPRPSIAFYEMLRVAKIGVVLIEPNDRYILDTPLQKILNNRLFYWFLSRFLGLHERRFDFEITGSYVFSISCREIEKMALGMQCHMVAFKGVNDYAHPRDRYEPARNNNIKFIRTKLLIGLHDFAASLRIIKYRNLCAVVFKPNPEDAVIAKLRKKGYDVIKFPPNPYLGKVPEDK